MKRVVIKKDGVQTHGADFETQELAEAWVTAQNVLCSFGKPERLVSEDRIAIEGEDISKASSMSIEPILGQEVKIYSFPAEFTVEYSDVTSEYASAEKLKERQLKRAFGELMIDKIGSINEGKNLSTEQVDAFMSNSLVTSLREHLYAGNISTFVAKLTASDVSAFFSAPEKAAVISECNQFLSSLEG